MSRLLIALALVLPSTALAQGAAGVIPGLQGGPVVPGVCVLSQDDLLTASKVSVAALQRVQQLAQAAQAEVDALKVPVEKEEKALATDTKIKEAERTRRAVALQARYQPIQAVADQRNRELALTRQKATARIVAEVQPLIVAAYKAHNCGMMLNRTAVLAGNPANDLTGEVMAALDARISSFPIEREVIPAGK